MHALVSSYWSRSPLSRSRLSRTLGTRLPTRNRSPRIAPFVAGLLLLIGTSLGVGSFSAVAEELPELPLTVNVNSADARTIANVLQGVGLSRAAAIVAYREANGAFKSVDALTAVKGVGDRTVELNATRILLSD